MKTTKLFEAGHIGTLEIPNRILMAPMGTKSDPDGGVCSRETAYFIERAKGGAGMIITGRMACSTKYEMRSHHVLDNYHHVNRLAMLCEKVHHYGTKLCVQIGPGLGRMIHQDPFTPPYSASAIPSHYYPELLCKPHTAEDIRYLAQATGFSASLAKRAGADAVELHAYGGYLLDQFMSSLYNKREDAYGGDLMGRMRFTLECIEEIQKQCGKDFPLIVKFTADQACEGGRTLQEGIEIAKLLEAAGVHALHMDRGCYECWYTQIPTVYGKEALQLDDATAIKASVRIPVIGHGKLHRPETAESALQNGQLDFVALGHQMIADPHWPQKVKCGAFEDIVPCIGCNECLYASHQGKDHSCAVNPQALRELDYPLTPATPEASVLIIGGGPAGCSAAITAARRGMKTELWERGSSLGGNLNTAGAPAFKKDVLRYRNYLIRTLERLHIPIGLNHEATPENIHAAGFDHVILACGSKPLLPQLPGSDGDHVTDAVSVLSGSRMPGKHNVIIGGGLVGCETALHLADLSETVTIVEMAEDILFGADHCQNNDAELRQMIRSKKIDLMTKSRVLKITAHYVELCGEDGQLRTLPCDTVIFATGFQTDKALEQALRPIYGNRLHVIGDALSPRKIYTAVHEGFHTVRLL